MVENYEIERKFLFNHQNYDFCEIIKDCKFKCIKDHYFNNTTRIRQVDNKFVITIKSLDFYKRQEQEFEVLCIKLPEPFLHKIRYYVTYKDNIFEINIYKNPSRFLDLEMQTSYPFILVEVELQDINQSIELPPWLGKEVTDNPRFYNYNLYRSLERNLV